MVRLQEITPTAEIKGVIKSKIINCRISRNKLVSQLDDGREISVPVALLTKQSILDKNVKPEQLKNCEIRGEGNLVYFPDIDEALPSWIIIDGLHSC